MSHDNDDIPALINSSPHKETYLFALSLAREGGKLIRDTFNTPKNITYKSHVDLVTETDQAVEKLLMGRIKDRFPDHTFVAEESVSAGIFPEELSDRPTWLIDPVDGTTNFVHQFPFTCVSIGFAVNKIVVLGVVFNPVLNEMFSGVRGCGAYKNGVKLQVSHNDELKRSLLATGFAYDRSDAVIEPMIERFRRCIKSVRDIRRAGSAALDMCYVAAGVLDCYYEVGVHAWDIAAGALFVEEAGGVVSYVDGRRPLDICKREVLVSNKHLHEKLIAMINQK